MTVFTRRAARGPDVEADAVRAAVGAVEDPELHRPLGDLGMVGDVTVDGPRRGAGAGPRGGSGADVRVTVRLTTASCPLRDTLQERVVAAAGTVPGVGRVGVTFDVLSDPERMALAQRLRAEWPGAGSGAATGSPDARALLDGERAPAARVYAVASGKGGVGKSTVTANLAVALAQAGQRVGVLDADVWGHSVPQLFGVRRAPVALSGLMLPVEAYGVRLMSTGFFVDEDRPVVWRGPMLHKALTQFFTDVHWGALDVLLLDLPPGTGDVTLSLLELCPEAALLAVTTPQVAAETVAARVGRMARDARMPVAGVVENMAALSCACCGHETPLFGSGGGERLAAAVDAPLLGRVPLDLALREAGDLGEPAVVRTPEAASATALRAVAAALPAARRSLVGRALPLSVVPRA